MQYHLLERQAAHKDGLVSILRLVTIISCFLVLLSACKSVESPIPVTPIDECKTTDMQQGIAYTSWGQGEYSLPEAKESLTNLKATCANWISLLVTYYQETIDSTDIVALDVTPTDADLRIAIQEAHQLGLKVMLKPHINLSNDLPEHWKGMIGQNFSEVDWQNWFSSYRSFIIRYAKLAEAYKVEQFSVGTELSFAAVNRSADWRKIVNAVRDVYSGELIYAANHSGEELSVSWWDAVDLIGVDAYYTLLDKNDPTVAELTHAWQPIVQNLEELSMKFNRPVVLTEIGYRSVDGTVTAPWDFYVDSALDLQEQVDAYEAVFESFYNEPWVRGFYWWNWSPSLDSGGSEDKSYTPYGKPAEEVLKRWFK
ncbi:MAG: hypothetical protein KC422_23785 [Trueperaceae bacterium]|nr:hypothetical protein [Trueperaceae bacterium]